MLNTFFRWWEFVITLCPMWIAPNLITLIGLVINLITVLVLSSFSYSATGPVSFGPFPSPWPFVFQAPSWAYLQAALGLFFYQTLDAIDGKQARRTGSSSPLGELFDHGCDSMTQGECWSLKIDKQNRKSEKEIEPQLKIHSTLVEKVKENFEKRRKYLLKWKINTCESKIDIKLTLETFKKPEDQNYIKQNTKHKQNSVAVFVTLNICYAMSLGTVSYGVLIVSVISVVMFYCAHWSTYCTGQLRFSKFDVTEAQMSVISVLLFTALFGNGVWETQIVGFQSSISI